MDLAVGIVRRGAAERCAGSIEDLGGVEGTIGQSSRALLVLIDDEGYVDRLNMNILETRYLDLDAEFVGSDQNLTARQGMSGGFLFLDGKPVGMAIETVDGRTVRFMRIEEIHQNVSRWIGTQNEIQVTEASVPAGLPKDSLPLVLSSVSAPAVGPEFLPENLLVDGASYVYAPTRNAEIILNVSTKEKTTLSRVRLFSEEKPGFAIPRRIVIFASPDSEGNRWKTFWSGEMSRDGILDTGPRAQSWARRIKIVIASSWAQGPVVIGSVVAN